MFCEDLHLHECIAVKVDEETHIAEGEKHIPDKIILTPEKYSWAV